MPAPPRRPVRNARSGNQSYARAYADHSSGIASAAPGTPITFVASSPGVKRDSLDLRANGWLTENFKRANGPVLWCHDHQRPPIGNATPLTERQHLKASVVFDQEDPFATQIESKIRRGVMSACSVGWDFVDNRGELLDYHRMTPEYLNTSAFYDLTELSIVPIGADPLAVAERSRRALGSLGRELVQLYDAQERPDSDATGPEIRAAVIAECHRLGIPLALDGPPRTDPRRTSRLVRTGDLPDLLRGLGVQIPATDPVVVPEPTTNDPAPVGETTPTSTGIDNSAARSILAAFTLRGAA